MHARTVKKTTEALVVVASKETGLEVNADGSTWSCLEKNMQDKITIQKLTVNP